MDIKIPEVGESIHEALVANWLKADGDPVRRDEVICELETDKINVEITAETSGILHIKVPAGETLPIGTLIAILEEGAVPEVPPADREEAPPAARAEKTSPQKPSAEQVPVNPAASRLAKEKGLDPSAIAGQGRRGRILVEDVMAVGRTATTEPVAAQPEPVETPPVPDDGRPVTRQAMSPIRQKIAQRLLKARQQTAMLTTFNEADLGHVLALRKKHQEQFLKRHGIKLGLMSFFVKACIESLKDYPAVNARIDGGDIVYHNYYDIGIAVGTDRGLVVPVLRNADNLTFAEIEKAIAALGEKARDKKLTLADLEGGTFTISNGGIYGSMLSTPILNTPQCGVLGMHAIQDRAVVRNGEIVIRPMMYLALSYDHQLIDGREAVGFLKLVKEYIEDPEELLLEL
jgi:2-oxoglutarate dehydrogenase E2 component (dihydrolipoamide succinyltransferase)